MRIKVKFPKGIQKVNIPFTPDIGSYQQLYKEISRVDYPKTTRRIEAHIVVAIDLEAGQTSYEMGEVVIEK